MSTTKPSTYRPPNRRMCTNANATNLQHKVRRFKQHLNDENDNTICPAPSSTSVAQQLSNSPPTLTSLLPTAFPGCCVLRSHMHLLMLSPSFLPSFLHSFFPSFLLSFLRFFLREYSIAVALPSISLNFHRKGWEKEGGRLLLRPELLP